MKGEYPLSLSDFEECKKIFNEKGTFVVCLSYYIDLDVTLGLETFDKMRAFYKAKGIDILKDAVSLPEVNCLALSLERFHRAWG